MRTILPMLALAALLGAAPALAQNAGDSSQATTPGTTGSPFATNGMPSNGTGTAPGGTATPPGGTAPQPPTTTGQTAAPAAPAR